MPILLLMAGVALCQSNGDALPYVIPVINRNDMEHQMSDDRYAQRAQSDQDFAARVAHGPTSFNDHGISAAKKGRYEEALKQFTEAITVSRNYADAYYNRGLVELKLYKMADAVTDFNTAVALSPYNTKYLSQAADSEFATGDMEGAIRDYDALLNLISKDKDIYLKRGTARSRIKDYKGALADLTKAKQMGGKGADSLMNAVSAKVVLASADKP